MATNVLASILLVKVREQAGRTEHLLDRIPPDRIDWRPLQNAMPLGELLGHLLEAFSGFCAAFYGLRRERLAHFQRLRKLPVNHRCEVEEARTRIREYMAHIEEGFTVLTDEDLARRVPTVFAPAGEPFLSVLLGNLEHVVNHKHQLFFYLKMLGVPVSTPDLYHGT